MIRLTSEDPAPPLPRQARSADKRRRLQRAARRVFTESGYAAASVDEVTRRAGVAVGAFYLHYRSKQQLLLDLMNELVADIAQLRLDPPRDATRAALRRNLERFLLSALRTDRENYGVIRAWQEAVRADPQLVRQDAKLMRWSDARVFAVFSALATHRLARPDTDVADFARMMNRHFWGLLGRAATMSARAFRAEVRVTSDVIFRYLFRP